MSRSNRGRSLGYVAVVALCAGVAPGQALAAGCPNAAVREHQIGGIQLPDCRAYEMVSPPGKDGNDALGEQGLVESAPPGDAVTYFTIAPLPGSSAPGEFPTYLATRDAGWVSQDLLPSSDPSNSNAFVLSMSGDLSVALVGIRPNEEGLPAGLPGDPALDNFYLRTSSTGDFRLLTSQLPGVSEPKFAATTPDDSHILLESTSQLLPEAAAETPNVYEYSEGRLRLADVLPNGTLPAEGAFAGPAGPAIPSALGGVDGNYYVEHALSDNGRFVFFTDVATGEIFVREDGAHTSRVSASQAEEEEETARPAFWRGATPDGRFAFFTSDARLTEDADASPGHPDLYRYETATHTLEDLTAAAGEPAGVFGVVGMSDDGEYAYFVADGAIAAGATAGEANLYEWHAGILRFVADLDTLEGLNVGPDEDDWAPRFLDSSNAAAQGAKSARVSADGEEVMFASRDQLTKYENRAHIELYIYDAPTATIRCVSCNPDGAPARFDAHLTGAPSESAPIARNTFLTGNMSSDGRFVFFQTEESLLPVDTNGVSDVYEWREGELALISTGQSESLSYFGDASPNGSNVFFFTRQQLVRADDDTNVDLYDARTDGGLAAQNEVGGAPGCGAATECRGSGPGLPPAQISPTELAPVASQVHALAPTLKPKPLTRPQLLVRALKACRKRPKAKRHSCEAAARKRYGKKAHRKTPARSKEKR